MKIHTAQNTKHERPNGRINCRMNGHANGHANGPANGHALEPGSSRAPQTAAAVEAPRNVATRGHAPQSRGGLSTERPAVSDDDRGISAAGAATTGAACAGPESYADLAGSRDPGIPPPLPGKGSRPRAKTKIEDDPRLLLVDVELAEDGSGFAEEMSHRVNLYESYKKLLLSADEKIRQRALERLLEMKYGKVGPGNPGSNSDELPRLNFDGVMGPSGNESSS